MSLHGGDWDSTLGLFGGSWDGRVKPLYGPPAGTNKLFTSKAGLVMGWSVTVGATAGTLSLYDGTDSSGTPFATVGGAANWTDSDTFMPWGIYVQNGLFAGSNANVTIQAVYFVFLYD